MMAWHADGGLPCSFLIFQGIWTRVAKKPYIFVIFHVCGVGGVFWTGVCTWLMYCADPEGGGTGVCTWLLYCADPEAVGEWASGPGPPTPGK